jgi:hypothetical protein
MGYITDLVLSGMQIAFMSDSSHFELLGDKCVANKMWYFWKECVIVCMCDNLCGYMFVVICVCDRICDYVCVCSV